MGDELLSRVHVFQESLEEFEGKTLLHGRRVELQVLQPSVAHKDDKITDHSDQSMAHRTSSVCAEGLPCDGIATYLQELEELLSLLSVSVLLLSSQGVVRHEQRVSAPSCSVTNNYVEVF